MSQARANAAVGRINGHLLVGRNRRLLRFQLLFKNGYFFFGFPQLGLGFLQAFFRYCQPGQTGVDFLVCVNDALSLLEPFQVLFRFQQVRAQPPILFVIKLLDSLSSANFNALLLIEFGRPVYRLRNPLWIGADQAYFNDAGTFDGSCVETSCVGQNALVWKRNFFPQLPSQVSALDNLNL